jgi:hypothetical protein
MDRDEGSSGERVKELLDTLRRAIVPIGKLQAGRLGGQKRDELEVLVDAVESGGRGFHPQVAEEKAPFPRAASVKPQSLRSPREERDGRALGGPLEVDGNTGAEGSQAGAEISKRGEGSPRVSDDLGRFEPIPRKHEDLIEPGTDGQKRRGWGLDHPRDTSPRSRLTQPSQAGESSYDVPHGPETDHEDPVSFAQVD